jgi:hypothetical protein
MFFIDYVSKYYKDVTNSTIYVLYLDYSLWVSQIWL